LTTPDYHGLEPICRKLQAAGWTLLQLRLAWSAVSHGRNDHLNVPDAAYQAARKLEVHEVDVHTWPKTGGKIVHRKGALIGITKHVAYVDVDGMTVTFSLVHGRSCYGSQQRFRGRISPEDCIKLLGASTEPSGLDKRILEALGDRSLRLRSLQEELQVSKTTLHHALKRLIYRKLIFKSTTTPHVYRRKECEI
jgi:hypothetical protein